MRTLFLAALVALPCAAVAQPVVLEGEVPDDGSDFHLVPFEVPAGTAELEVRHDDLSERNVLDFGLDDPDGFRGWGGGNREPAIVGEQAASRSYLAGPMPAGTWAVVIGKALVEERPARYRLEIELREAPTLAPETERPYEHVAALSSEGRWYAGDFHVHSEESGDARPDLDEIATFARGRGLDFVMLSDHNTTSQLRRIVDAQGRHGALLFVPGVEFTTYAGHMNGLGATSWVSHRIGHEGWTIDDAAAAFDAQGAILSVNHPVLDLGSSCLGCAFEHDLAPPRIGAVEIATGGWSQTGYIFGEDALAFWDDLCARGSHAAAVGGSDDHRAGVDLGAFQSPIGDPTTMVFAEELSVPALLAGVRAGRTVVKLQGPDDPMIELAAEGTVEGDTVRTETPARITATVTGGAGHELRWVIGGRTIAQVPIDGDPFVAESELAPGLPDPRLRAEVWVDGAPRTVTSHLWAARPDPEPEPGGDGGGEAAEGDGGGEGGGCGCGGGGAPAGALGLLAALLALRYHARRDGTAPGAIEGRT